MSRPALRRGPCGEKQGLRAQEVTCRSALAAVRRVVVSSRRRVSRRSFVASTAWGQELQGRGVFVLGSALGGAQTATTVRFPDGGLQLSQGSLLNIKEFIAGIEVVSSVDQKQAIELAAAHPLARYHAIEVRPFYSESRP